MKSVATIYYVSGKTKDMLLENDDCEKLCDWFMNDYSESKMKIESNGMVRIINKKLICEITITKLDN